MTFNQIFSKGLVFILLFSTGLSAQDQPTGMPGDFFSLYGALDLFKKSESPEEFEEMLNKKENKLNNLDLNNDGDVDYIRVIDIMEGDSHAITLQVPISKKESQDIAVIAIEKTTNEYATLQIIGDEEIYGEELIVEPYSESSQSTSRGGPNPEFEISRVVMNVWLWPSVRWIYQSNYRVYVSPWYWNHYPRIWRPWRTLSWAMYSPRIIHWRVGYRVTPTIRVSTARRIYIPRRSTSLTVVNRYKVNKTSYVSKKNKRVVSNGSRTAVSTTNKKAIVNKSNTKSIAKERNRKTMIDKTTGRSIASDGNKKAVVDRTTSKAVGTTRNKKVAGKKTSKTVKAANGNKSVKAKKTKTKKVKKKKN